MDDRYFAAIKDYQGNIMALAHSGFSFWESTQYYPFGMPWIDRNGRDRYKFSGKEYDATGALNLYDFEARMYDPALTRFLSPDPLADRYPAVSPYAYCANNPIRNTDPSGQIILDLDNEGRVVNQVADNKKDQIRLVDASGDVRMDKGGNALELEFPYATIESVRTENYNLYDKEKNVNIKGSADILVIRGDENATKIFEFLSDNITADEKLYHEYSLIKTGLKGDLGLNFVSNGHHRGSEPGMSYLFSSRIKNGYTVREMIHSHPKSISAGNNDRIFADQIWQYYVGLGQPSPIFKIYHVPTKQYSHF